MAIKYYSTNDKNLAVTLKDAVVQGQAPDGGLFLPNVIPVLPTSFFAEIENLSFQEIGYEVAKAFLKDEVPEEEIKRIVNHTIDFDVPLFEVDNNAFSLELFHGPTMAFKDFGARFMSQLLRYFSKDEKKKITILAATSGDTGSAVANGFLGVEGIQVIILYPSGKVSEIQEKQFTTLGQNIYALEIEGTFDDCQRLVKTAFADKQLCQQHFLTSANSINIARLIPQTFYYLHAFAQLKKLGKPLVFSVPSGNFGNLTAGVIAQRMGLPVQHFVASTNVNDIVPKYLQDGIFEPRTSIQTISNAMDVGNPSNFARMLNLFEGDQEKMVALISGYAFTDAETAEVIQDIYSTKNYTLDPHGAVGYLGLRKYLDGKEVTGVFLETAHPAKFKEVVEEVIKSEIEIPSTLLKFMARKKQSESGKSDYTSFREFLNRVL
jgi:threonine synthase